MKYISFGSKMHLCCVGLNLENFLFELSASGIQAKNIKKHKHTLKLVVDSINFSTVQKIAQNFDISVSIKRQTGFAHFMFKLPYMIGTILAILYSICFTHFMTHTISEVKIVVSQENLQAQENSFSEEDFLKIESFLAEQGLSKGKFFSGKSRAVENAILANFEGIEACSVVISGNVVKVHLSPVENKQEQPYSKIIAQKNCIISSITTYSGKALVSAGDIVQKGQTLVEASDGVLPRAQIFAKVWYVGSSLHFAQTTELVPTGKTQTKTAVKIFGKTILPNAAPSFEYYRQTNKSKMIENLFLPVEIVFVEFQELKLVSVSHDFQQEKEQVFAAAKQDAQKQTNGKIEECTYSVVSENNITKVDCYLQVTEQIGKKQ